MKQRKTKNPPTPPRLVHITRSYSYKLNCKLIDPRLEYESRDFFVSQSAESFPEEAEKTSAALYTFCKREVLKAVNAEIEEILALKDLQRREANERKVQLQNRMLDNARPKVSQVRVDVGEN